MGLIARLHGLGASLRASVSAAVPAVAHAVGRGLRSLGLADVLVLGGGVAFATGLVQRYGWPLALIVVGGIALLGGLALALRESGKAARR